MKNRRTVTIVVAAVSLAFLALVLWGCHAGFGQRGYPGQGYHNGGHYGRGYHNGGHYGHGGTYYVPPPGANNGGGAVAPATPPGPPPPPAGNTVTGYPTQPTATYGPVRQAYPQPQQFGGGHGSGGYCAQCAQQKRGYNSVPRSQW